MSTDLSGMKIGLVRQGFDICETDVSELVHKAAVDKLSLARALVEDVSVPMHEDGIGILFLPSLSILDISILFNFLLISYGFVFSQDPLPTDSFTGNLYDSVQNVW